ncbi:MAG: hypothetical protein GY697_07490 [Desulfobacterales bacterium]|nr:hypothetical protein [Desulfobacterales bacterium]
MRTILRHMNPIAYVAGFLIGALFLASTGCGVKAPPVAPDVKPPVIATFAHTLENGTLTLSWALSAGSPIPQSYAFYRSRVSLADKPCKGCPLVFKRLMTIAADGRKDGVETVSVEPGYRYGFKMTATDANGLEGPDSQTVSFSY